MKQKCPDCVSVEILSGTGNGKCSRCYGSGKVGTIADDIAGGKRACERCHGSGQCQTCGGHGVVVGPDKPRPHAKDDINPFDDKVAIKARCPKCGAIDWFEWKFLGKLTDPVCGHSWYVGPAKYTLMQIRAVVAAGGKMAKYMNKGLTGEGAWIGKILGGFTGMVFGIAFRLP